MYRNQSPHCPKPNARHIADVNRFATAAAHLRTSAVQDEADAGPFSDADAHAVRDALNDIAYGEKPKSASESFAKVAARVGLKSTTQSS